MNTSYDRVIIGAGIYGLYAAIESGKRGHRVLVIEKDEQAITRGSYVNQARLHSGYHYPRSVETASKSRDYFFRFLNDFSSAIYTSFRQLYAISHKDSLTTAREFEEFCNGLQIKCEPIEDTYFKAGMVDGVYDTLEYAIDNDEVRRILLRKCDASHNVEVKYNTTVVGIEHDKGAGTYLVKTTDDSYKCSWLLNATYASTNQVLAMLQLPPLDIKYEQCEVILCEVSKSIENVGITVMDGPFFSIMPFGMTGLHSLTSVSHTPHSTSYDVVPKFDCQRERAGCNDVALCNCNACRFAPKTQEGKMLKLARSYLNDGIEINPVRHLYSVKPILNSCEKDDARPTLVREYDECPGFYTVFSGKLNTIYDLDEVL